MRYGEFPRFISPFQRPNTCHLDIQVFDVFVGQERLARVMSIELISPAYDRYSTQGFTFWHLLNYTQKSSIITPGRIHYFLHLLCILLGATLSFGYKALVICTTGVD